MKECQVGGLAGASCSMIKECYFQEALKAESDDPKALASFRTTVKRNKQGCLQSGEVLAAIDIC